MKQIIAMFLLITTMYGQEKNTIVFAPLPMENAVKTLEIFSPMIEYLEKNLNKKIDVAYRGSNSEVVDGLVDGSIDLAYLGPLPYIDLIKKTDDVKIIVQFLEKNNKDTYTCTLFIREDSNLDLHSIKDKKFALTQKFSTCGYVFAQEILLQNNSSMEQNQFQYIGSHYDTIVEVLSGSYDIGTAKTSIFKKFEYLGVKPVAVSEANPGLVLVANSKTLGLNTLQELQTLMLHADDAQRQKWGEKIQRKSIIPQKELFKVYEKRVKDIQPQDEK